MGVESFCAATSWTRSGRGTRSASPRTRTSALRIAASEYFTAVIESPNTGEANGDPINRVRQRSRWYKGYLHTWLVHIRELLKLYRTLGPRAFLWFNLVLAGTLIIRGTRPRVLI